MPRESLFLRRWIRNLETRIDDLEEKLNLALGKPEPLAKNKQCEDNLCKHLNIKTKQCRMMCLTRCVEGNKFWK